MDEIVGVLLEKESLEREEFIALMEGAKAPETAAPPAAPTAPPPATGETPTTRPLSDKARRVPPSLRPEPA